MPAPNQASEKKKVQFAPNQGANCSQLQEALFPWAYNMHMAFCDGLQNQNDLISPASHRSIHSAVCIAYACAYVTFPKRKIFFKKKTAMLKWKFGLELKFGLKLKDLD